MALFGLRSRRELERDNVRLREQNQELGEENTELKERQQEREAKEPLVSLLMREMCDECDAFVGNPHSALCSLKGTVHPPQATSKLTTLEHVQAEEGIALCLRAKEVRLVLDNMSTHHENDDYEEVEELLQAFREFMDEVHKSEGEPDA